MWIWCGIIDKINLSACFVVKISILKTKFYSTAAKRQTFKATYDISPNGAKASRSCAVSISGLRSPTKIW